MELRVGVVGLALLCASWSSHGLVLGPVAGAALIGRPLELVIPVQGASGEDASAACFEVEGYHGDRSGLRAGSWRIAHRDLRIDFGDVSPMGAHMRGAGRPSGRAGAPEQMWG